VKLPKPPTYPPKKDDVHIGSVSKAGMLPPKFVPKKAPREEAQKKKATKQVPSSKGTPSSPRDGQLRGTSSSPPPAQPPGPRSRTPGARHRRTPKPSAHAERTDKRGRSESRSDKHDQSDDESYSRSSYSPTRNDNRKTKNKKAIPQSRSRSPAPGARIAARAASDRNSARTANPNPQPFEDRAVKEQGIRLNPSQPKCTLGHNLTCPYATDQIPHVQPPCHFCPRRFIVGSSICVCHLCEPIYIACVRCTFKLPPTDEDQD
jgi:hypothetical protein